METPPTTAEHHPAPTAPVVAAPRQVRELPDVWTHRTHTGTYSGPLDETAPPPRVARRDRRRASPLDVLRVLARSDFRARYRAQALGVLWSLLYPLVMMGIMSLIFTRVFRSSVPDFPIFLLIGLIFWQWTTNSIGAATQVFVANADIIKRTVFARQLLPVSAVVSYGVNASMEAMVLLAFIPIFPHAFRLTPALLLVPVILAFAMLLLVGIGLATSVLNVVYRDVGYIVNTALLLLYWLTPIVYPPDVLPQPYQTVLAWNPLAAILSALRQAIMLGRGPDALGWAMIVLPTAVVLVAGWLIFDHYERMVLDYV